MRFEPWDCPTCGTRIENAVMEEHPLDKLEREEDPLGWTRSLKLARPKMVRLIPCGHEVEELVMPA